MNLVKLFISSLCLCVFVVINPIIVIGQSHNLKIDNTGQYVQMTLFLTMTYDRKKQKKVSKKSRYKQGVIDPRSCRKLYEHVKNEPVKFQSALELQFIRYCEACSSVAYWANEPLSIKYCSRIDGKIHEYFPDFIIESTTGQRTIVETKPYEQTHRPDSNASLWLKEQWIKNVDKWKAAEQWCKERSMKFMIVTEKFFP